MIDRQTLEKQVENLEAQERHLQAQILECRGAQKQCRFFLGRLLREEDERKAVAEANGQQPAPAEAG